MVIDSPIIRGSYNGSGSFTQSGSVTISGSLTVTGPIIGALTGSVDSASFATTASNALTASSADNLTVRGTLTAQTIVVQTVTSSIVYSSGSNIFGNSLSNTQQFTGSVQVTGSTHYLLGNVGIGEASPYGQLTIKNITNNLGGLNFTEASDGSSRRWQIRNDVSVFGDFSIRQSTTQTGTTFTDKLYISSGGNVGIDTIPAAWAANYRSLELPQATSLTTWNDGSGRPQFLLGSNNYFDGSTYRYLVSSERAAQYYQGAGRHVWRYAVAGTAGDPLSFIWGMELDANGNLGLGVTPSAWSFLTALQVKNASIGGVVDNAYFSANCYFDGTNWRYIATNEANRIEMQNGNFEFYQAPSGTAGNTITFTQAMTLHASGNLSLGNTDNTYLFDIQKNGGNASVVQRIRNTGTNTNDDALLYFNTQGNRDFSIGLDRSTGTFNFTGAAANVGSTIHMAIDAISGNVGIGTTSPEALLHVNKSTAGGEGGYIYIDNPADSTLNNSVGIRFGSSAGASFAGVATGEIKNLLTNASDGASALTFETWNGASVGERMRITSAGNVEVGNASRAAATSITIINDANSNGAVFGYARNAGQFLSGAGAGDLIIGNATNENILFGNTQTGATEYMRITSAGNVGIGTTSPDGTLDVVGNISYVGNTNSSTFVVRNNGAFSAGGGSGATFVVQYGGQNIATITNTGTGQRDAVLTLRDEGVAKVVIAANNSRGGDTYFNGGGNVGIGTTSPAFPLEVQVNSSTAYTTSSRGNVLRVYNNTTSTNTFAGIELGAEGNANAAVAGINGIWTGSGSAALSFYTRDNSTFGERMRITSGGNVGIGTTPSYRLDVRQITTDPVAFFGFSQTSSSSNGLIKLNSGRIPQSGGDFTGESGVIFGHSGGTMGVNFDGQGGYIKSIRVNTYAASGQSDSALVFATALDNVDYERMRITSGGNVLIGTTTDASTRVNVSGTTRSTAFQSDAGSLSVAPATDTTFYTPSAGGLYMARVYLPGNFTQNWCAVIIFAFEITNILVVNQTNSINVSTVVSGTSIQVRQIGAVTYTMNWEVIRIA
jgi:hypothetical protein